MTGGSNVSYIRVFLGKDGQGYYETRSANNKTLTTSEGYTDGLHAARRAALDSYPGIRIRVDQPE